MTRELETVARKLRALVRKVEDQIDQLDVSDLVAFRKLFKEARKKERLPAGSTDTPRLSEMFVEAKYLLQDYDDFLRSAHASSPSELPHATCGGAMSAAIQEHWENLRDSYQELKQAERIIAQLTKRALEAKAGAAEEEEEEEEDESFLEMPAVLSPCSLHAHDHDHSPLGSPASSGQDSDVQVSPLPIDTSGPEFSPSAAAAAASPSLPPPILSPTPVAAVASAAAAAALASPSNVAASSPPILSPSSSAPASASVSSLLSPLASPSVSASSSAFAADKVLSPSGSESAKRGEEGTAVSAPAVALAAREDAAGRLPEPETEGEGEGEGEEKTHPGVGTSRRGPALSVSTGAEEEEGAAGPDDLFSPPEDRAYCAAIQDALLSERDLPLSEEAYSAAEKRGSPSKSSCTLTATGTKRASATASGGVWDYITHPASLTLLAGVLGGATAVLYMNKKRP